MKKKENFRIKKPMIYSILGLLMLSLWIVSCEKDNSVEPLMGNGGTGTDVINSTPGGNYNVDKTHSSVMWHTLYYNDNALLTGRFNSFRVDVNFDEANIAGSQIDAWVQLSSFNTGEPGRDGYGKCGPGYLGVEWDTIAQAAIPSTDTAWFSSTSIEPYGDGYLAKGDFIFNSVTKSMDLYFTYQGEHEYQGSTGVTTRAGFVGHFEFMKSDYNVSSSSVGDLITVEVNANYRKL